MGDIRTPISRPWLGGGMGSSYPSLMFRAVIKGQEPGISPGYF